MSLAIRPIANISQSNRNMSFALSSSRQDEVKSSTPYSGRVAATAVGFLTAPVCVAIGEKSLTKGLQYPLNATNFFATAALAIAGFIVGWSIDAYRVTKNG